MELRLNALKCGYEETSIVCADTVIKEGFNLISANSGSGKSTLLKTISFLIPPLEGEIFFNFKKIVNRDDFWLSKCVLLNQNNFFLSGTVLDTLKMPFSFKAHRDKYFDLEYILELFNVFKIERELIKKSVNELSGGQQQRIVLFRTLALKSEVLLMDEPTTGLDQELVRSVFRYLEKYCKKRICVVVSHETIAFEIADRVMKIDNGVLIDD